MNKRLIHTLAFLVSLLAVTSVGAQITIQEIVIDATSHGTVVDIDSAGQTVAYDDGGGSGIYSRNKDYYVTFTGTCDSSVLSVTIQNVDIHRSDTLFIYDGRGTSGRLRAKINSANGNWQGKQIFITPGTTPNMMTLRFKTDGAFEGEGFAVDISCGQPCERTRPHIAETFYRTRNGEIYDSATLKSVPYYDSVYDTIYVVNGDGDSVHPLLRIDTGYFTGANLCVGDGVLFRGYGEYTHEHGYYTPRDETSLFSWESGIAGDSLVGINETLFSYGGYQTNGCFDLVLSITDSFGCSSTYLETVKVRTSENPIKTVFTLMDICNRDSLRVNLGYDGDNATITLKPIETAQAVSKVNDIRTFLPDGSCPNRVPPPPDPRCYEAPVTFTEFPANRRVESKEDICSICINMEHSFIGDVTVTIICPTGQEAVFWLSANDAARRSALQQLYPGAGGLQSGGGTYLGIALDGHGWDSGNKCDSLTNPFGIGWDYCFSRNSQYTLVTGDNASISGHPVGDYYIVSTGVYRTNGTIATPPCPYPAYFTVACPTVANYTVTSKIPSNREAKTDYYLPFTDFSELVGCPLNGEWKINVCDLWGADNGWLFSWTMDICNVTLDKDCKYTVEIDSLVLTPSTDPRYYDYELGHYRGLEVHRESLNVSQVLTPDTAGSFPVNVHIYDDFGCRWDTVTRLTSYWTPQPSLGPDTSLCGVDHIALDASDSHTKTQNYSYIWEPFGQNTDTIETATWQNGEMLYVAQVTNTQKNTRCTTRDTIVVNMLKQPIPGYLPSVMPLEGCAPLTIYFENLSREGEKYFWDFGDGITSERESPTHTYDAGVYDFRYIVASSDGCLDSLVYKEQIAVYETPKPAFSWEPTYPSVLHPTVTLNNQTKPDNDNVDYFWEVQYNRNNFRSVETLLDKNPAYTFTNDEEDGDISGNYSLRLIARTKNLAPTGNLIYCRDTVENSILVVNDFLQFPNVVSPNGDGINDRFEIRNLIEGGGYPTNSLYIYNKWGTLVYHKDNISTADDFWDPSNMPVGTYFYRFTAKGYNGNIEHNGVIEVIK